MVKLAGTQLGESTLNTLRDKTNRLQILRVTNLGFGYDDVLEKVCFGTVKNYDSNFHF